MQKIRLLLLLLSIGVISHAQQKVRVDTAARKDTALLEELKESVLDNIPTVSLDESDQGDDGGQNISSVLTGRDPFYTAASFNFSEARFRIRGYENDYFGTSLNGIPMDNLDNGFTPYGLWGGLNDVMRSRANFHGMQHNPYSFGEIGSTTNIDVRASKQWAQTRIGYANANRNYTHRFAATHSTGMNNKGWAFSLSASRRWADEGYVPGTFYNGWSYFGAVDKRFKKHLLSLVVFGAPTENGRQGATVKEMMDLAGKKISEDAQTGERKYESNHFYNPNWGYQNGVKRNASIGKTNQPVILLSDEFKINSGTTLNVGAGYSFGDRSVTALDWYNAPDPRPDYYRYLPSYIGRYASTADPVQAQQTEDLLRSDENARQINWQRLYDVNRSSFATIDDANGITGNKVSGKRSRYIVEERVVNTSRINLNAALNTKLGSNVDLSVGASYQAQQNKYFKKVDDLLGGDFYVDLNQFAERDFPANNVANQNDVNQPNRILKEGDKFGYNYNINLHQASTWAQAVYKKNKIELFGAGQYSHTDFQRIGNTKNGLFLDQSYGPSKKNVFDNFGVKAGVLYKVDRANFIYLNGAYLTKAPYFDNVFISARTRNTQQEDVKSEEIQSVEGGYLMNMPKVKIHLSGYYTHFNNQLDVMSFFHDTYQNLVNYAISGISKMHFGGEFGVEAKVMQNVTVNAAAAVGRYYYDSRQHAIITVDNNTAVLGEQTIYAQNFRVPSSPQEAYSLGVTYRSPKYWFLSLTGNYFDQDYLGMNPLRRTYDALKGVDPKSEDYSRIFDQTKFDAQFQLDFFGGYSWKLPPAFSLNHRSTFLMFNLGISNLLNNKNILTGGYEQLRFDQSVGIDNKVNVDKFPPKLFYAYGLNYFASATIRF